MKDNEREQPLVSFIIPVYNLPAEMVRECIESITSLSLSVGEREIIVVDDGSDVAPISELTDLRDRIVYVRQSNKGLPGARNTGLRIATGRYVQFIDADDMLVQYPYEHCLDIVRYKNPDIVMFEITSRHSRRGARMPFVCPQSVSGRQYMRDNNLRAAACGYIFRRDIIRSLRFDESLRSHEDEDFTPRLVLQAERLFSTTAKAYFYRQRKGSITHNGDNAHIDRRLANMETVICRLRDLALTLPDEDKPAMSRRVAQLTMDYLYNTIKLKHDATLLEATVERLRDKGLFPLPDKKYTRKYTYFRKCMNHRLTRELMVRFL